MRKRASTSAACVAATVFGLPAGRAAPECPPAVILDGDATAVTELAEMLRARGMDAPRAGCAGEHASVERVDDGLSLSITDVDGRHSERKVSDAATAVTVLESFATIDPDPGFAAPSMAPAQKLDQPVLVSRAVSTVPGGGIAAALEGSLGTDHSLWFGLRGRGCVQLGRFCLGGEVRFARDTVIAGDAVRTASTRTAADLLVVFDVPIARGRFTITPGAGLGVGWMRGRSGDSETDGDSEMFDVDTGGLRANAHLAIAVPVGRGVSLTLGTSLDLAPFAHTQPFEESGIAIAGEPRGFGRVDLGLEMVRR